MPRHPSPLARLRAHVMVDGLGAAVLRFDRFKLSRRLAHPRPDDLFGPPLRSSARLKELISRHYLRGRYAPLCAWVTSGAPVEFLVALGFHVHYPENHGAVCGIRRTALPVMERAEDEGFSRDLCSYARTDFGTVLTGQTPVGRLPRPDLLVCCTNICQTVLYWYQWLAWHFQVPLVVIDTPFLYDQARTHDIAYVRRQIEGGINTAERVSGRTLRPLDLERITVSSKEAVRLWSEILATAKHRPAPFTAFDAFIHLAPVVEMRGEDDTVRYYEDLLSELRQRTEQGVAAVKTERHRLLWDNLPIWARVRWLSDLLARGGASLVASTYTNAWGEVHDLIDPKDPVASAARVYLHALLNRSTGHKLRLLQTMTREYAADGVILHSDRSCKPYSLGQVDQRARLPVPAMLLEADHNDPRAFSEEQVTSRVQAFLEMLA